MKIVAALDRSDKDEAVQHAVAALAKAVQDEVVLLNVVNPFVDAAEIQALRREEAVQQVLADRRAYLQERAKALGGVSVTTVIEEMRRREDVAEVIARVAREHQADMVAVASKRVASVSGLLLGSTAHALLGLSPCPVLVIRPQ